MLVWKDIGLKKNEAGNNHERVSYFANNYAQRIGQLPHSEDSYNISSVASSIIRTYDRFFEDTKIVLRWDDVPKTKRRVDFEQYMRAMFFGYTKPFNQTPEDIDKEIERSSGKTLEKDKGFSFYHSIECVVHFCENNRFNREKSVEFLGELLSGKALYDPLYVREMLNHPERLGFEAKPEKLVEFARAISANYERPVSYDEQKIFSIADEVTMAKDFFAQRKTEGLFPDKFIVHSVDTQGYAKAWRTYKKFAAITSSKLASVVTYGLVPGGVLGGINPTDIYGTLDRADLLILNWYPQFQGGVIIPTEFFAKDGFGCEITGSRSVMIDGDKGKGRDIIIRPNQEGILPHVSPSEFVVVVPLELQKATISEITSLHHKLRRSSPEVAATLERCIGYDPSLWENFHYFNEWLQTTAEGNALLEDRIGHSISDFKKSDKI